MLDKINMSEDCAKLILRLTVGFLVLLHGVAKLMNPEMMGFVGGLFSNLGLPAFLAYAIYIGEIVAPIMMIVGYKTREASALIVVTMVVAILLVHTKDLFSLGQSGGYALELQAMFLFGAVAVFGLGAGKYTVAKCLGK